MGPRQRPRRERARPDQRRGARGLRQGQQLTQPHPNQAGATFATGLVRISQHCAHLQVGERREGGQRGPLERDLGAPVTDPDAVRRWISDYRELTIAQSGHAPAGMPSAFVLQYHLDPFATVMATAALRTRWLLDAEMSQWSIWLDPTYLYPSAVTLAAGHSRDIADDAERVALAEAAYTTAARELAEAFPAEDKMSTRQRFGMVADMWAGAVHRLEGRPVPKRRSCCLIYALPGLQECAGCPRTRGARL